VVEFTFVSQEGTSLLLSINLANIFRFFVFFTLNSAINLQQSIYTLPNTP